MRPSFFITTPIFYVNDVPHIGHAYTTVAADTLARYKRITGYDVLFLTGTDEHGQKIEKAAAARGESPRALADRLAEGFKALWKRLNISHDDFIRTTEARHIRAVNAFYERVRERGDITLGAYEGWYCIPCESFWTELQLADGNCPDCRRAVERVSEPGYFFRLSRFQQPLLDHLERHPEFIAPASRRNEILQFIRGGLRDLSISRTGFSWGIPLPGDPGHVIYVWFDALVNYLTATGFPEPGFERRWPAQVHFLGKDILRFHAIYWPAFLLSAKLPLPGKIVSHGWWTVEGEKMSKSRGNVVDPHRVIDHFGVDPLRYFLLREVPFGLDGDFSIHALLGRTNADLANDLGNLLSRTVAMLHRYLGGTVPEPGAPDDVQDLPLIGAAQSLPGKVAAAMEEPAFDRALAAIWEVVSAANRYVDGTAPWALSKAGDTARLNTVLYTSLEAQRIASLFLYPFMPDTAERMWAQLGVAPDLATLQLERAATWGGLRPGTRLPPPTPLFPRLDPDALPKELTRKETPSVQENIPAVQPPVAPPATEAETISIHDFSKIRLQVGVVKEAEAVRKSNKLLRLQVDIGTEVRQIVAGIGRKYTPEDLVGRQVVVVTNLRPATLMGIESHGMLLAAGAEEVLAVLAPVEAVPPGTRVK